MPKLSLNVKILNNDIWISAQQTSDENTNELRFPPRDHYHRFELFCKKQYPEQDSQFVAKDVAQKAALADRDTDLGVLDTLSRELITYWMPEVELFLAVDVRNEARKNRTGINDLGNGLRRHVLHVAIRVKCTDPDTRILQAAIVQRAHQYLQVLEPSCKTLLNKRRVQRVPNKPTNRTKSTVQNSSKTETRVAIEMLPESQILDSSTVWSLADTREPILLPISPTVRTSRKRRFTQINVDEEPDPADNGQAWEGQGNYVKRRRFEFPVSKTLIVLDNNLDDRVHTVALHDESQKVQMIDLTGNEKIADQADTENELIHKVTERALPMPGSFS